VSERVREREREEKEKERESERETVRERERDRQTDRDRQRQRDRETERGREREREDEAARRADVPSEASEGYSWMRSPYDKKDIYIYCLLELNMLCDEKDGSPHTR